MSETNQSLRERLEAWAGLEDAAQRKAEWLRIAEDPSCGEAVFALISGLREAAVKKQALAEERQELINKWQREKEAALQDVETIRKKLEDTRRETEKTEERMRGYEKQFVSLQEDARRMEEKADYMAAQCEQARKEMQESKDQAAELRERLTEAKQYGAETAMKAGELENLFSVKLYRKLHREKEGN